MATDSHVVVVAGPAVPPVGLGPVAAYDDRGPYGAPVPCIRPLVITVNGGNRVAGPAPRMTYGAPTCGRRAF